MQKERQTKRSDPRRPPRARAWVIAKWVAISLAGIFLFLWGKEAACQQRGYIAFGGEYLLLLFPVVWWLTETTIKDWRAAVKSHDE